MTSVDFYIIGTLTFLAFLAGLVVYFDDGSDDKESKKHHQ